MRAPGAPPRGGTAGAAGAGAGAGDAAAGAAAGGGGGGGGSAWLWASTTVGAHEIRQATHQRIEATSWQGGSFQRQPVSIAQTAHARERGKTPQAQRLGIRERPWQRLRLGLGPGVAKGGLECKLISVTAQPITPNGAPATITITTNPSPTRSVTPGPRAPGSLAPTLASAWRFHSTTGSV